jgi:hypothetical protein
MAYEVITDRCANDVLPAHQINMVLVAGKQQVGKTQDAKVLMCRKRVQYCVTWLASKQVYIV